MGGSPTSQQRPPPGEGTPGEPTQEERFTAQLVWGLDVFFQIIGPYLMWRLQAPESRFVAHHARACINHVLTAMLLMLADCVVFGVLVWVVSTYLEPEPERGIVLYVVAVVAVGALWLLTLLALVVGALIIHVAGLLAARAGRLYEPPLCWRFVR